MVFVAIRRLSTEFRFTQQRVIARTILLISTGSRFPFRLRTCIDVWAELSVCRVAAVPNEVSIKMSAGEKLERKFHVPALHIQASEALFHRFICEFLRGLLTFDQRAVPSVD